MNYASAILALKSSENKGGEPDFGAIDVIIDRARKKGLTVHEIADLAAVYASSGENISFYKYSGSIADIASTGGPSSLSTLLCPLYLTWLGAKVSKLGVPGRPAGGIDVLAQIDGYKTQLSSQEIHTVFKICGYAHFNAGKFAPLDAAVFKYRKEIDALNIPDLVIASLISKKLCVDVNNVGLDVRVARFGNFGATWSEAKDNSIKFCEVATFLGKNSKCFLTNGNYPYQPYIGRAEALLALHNVFYGNIEESLLEHDELCFSMAAELLGAPSTPKPSGKDIQKIFEGNIKAQGGSVESFHQKVDAVSEAHDLDIVSNRAGWLRIDLQMIREVFVDIQSHAASGVVDFPDPCGLILKANAGQFVEKGNLLATLRCAGNSTYEVHNRLKSAFVLDEKNTPIINQYETVTNG
ncbi:MAG: hypothetical protein ABW166_11825 [Sedimenticola sp.]